MRVALFDGVWFLTVRCMVFSTNFSACSRTWCRTFVRCSLGTRCSVVRNLAATESVSEVAARLVPCSAHTPQLRCVEDISAWVPVSVPFFAIPFISFVFASCSTCEVESGVGVRALGVSAGFAAAGGVVAESSLLVSTSVSDSPVTVLRVDMMANCRRSADARSSGHPGCFFSELVRFST